jgi:hypothetical protein
LKTFPLEEIVLSKGDFAFIKTLGFTGGFTSLEGGQSGKILAY